MPASNTNKTKPTPRATKKKGPGERGKNWTFPKEPLEEAISIARAIEEKNAGKPMPAREVAKAVGYRQPD